MPREIPIPVAQELRNGVTVSLYKQGKLWRIQVQPVGLTAQEKLRPRWTARYELSRTAIPKEPTVRDGCLALAEELCLALDGWLELCMVPANL